jgi:hypothetical protein
MDTEQLNFLLKSNVVTEPFFIGVIPANKLFSKNCGKADKNKSCFLIANTDNDTGGGEHWLALFYDGKGCMEVFDPYGMAPHAYPNMVDFFNARSACTKYNEHCVQSPFSNLCGLHCMFVAYHKCLNVTVSLKDVILNNYLDNVDYNDCMVLEFTLDKFPQLTQLNVINRMKKTVNCE